MFCETLAERIERVALGTAWALQPRRIAGLRALGGLWLSELLAPVEGLPDPRRSLNAAGLCGFVKEPSAAATSTACSLAPITGR
jgi:hypothetical protein